MPRPKAATPAAQIRSVLRFFETANLELASVAFELVRAALADRKAKKKLTTPAKPAEKVEPLEQKVMVGTNYPAANAPGGRLDTPPPPAQVARPANKSRVQPKKKKPAAPAGAGKKRGVARPPSGGGSPTGASGDGTTNVEVLPEQHPPGENGDAADLTW